MDVTNLILYLKSKITDQSIDQQMVSKAIRLLELGTVFTAQTFASLPSAVGRSGELWFVLYDGLYWSTGEYWLSIVSTSQVVSWSWGCNNYGNLGDNTTTNKSSPVSVVGGFTDWCQISAGDSHQIGVRTSGSAWAWGRNVTGRLGDGATTNRSSPVSVVGGFSDWRQVAAGSIHTVAVRTSGSAWAWGDNVGGKLGDNTTTNRSSPVSVVGGFTDWCQVDTGLNHTVAVRLSGSAWSWGVNSSGQLGDNTTTSRSSPVSVVGGFTDWCQISGGSSHSVAVRISGSVWSWGTNTCGRLGDNTTTIRSSPVSVVGGFSDWCKVDAGATFSVAVRTNGTAWAWGYNNLGQLGDNTTTPRSSPVSVVGGFTNWCQVSAGAAQSVAARSSGSAWAWGCNNAGQLGDNTLVSRSSPVSVVGGFSDWSQASSGFNQTLAIRNRTT